MAFIGNVPGTVFIPSAEFLNDSFQANGQPTAANNIVFDGANNTDEQRGSNVGGQTRAANESIAEVQILTNQFDAEWGRASGAVINAVTKSGTNHFAGLRLQFLYEQGDDQPGLLREGAGTAPKPDVGKKEWGGTIGGPIVRNKLHFFFSLERTRTSTGTSPTPSRRVPRCNFATSAAKSRRGTPCGASTISSTRSTPGRSAGCRKARPSSTGSRPSRKRSKSYDDETDLDQTMVGTLTSVVSDTKVNTVRDGLVLEDTVHANPAWRALNPEYERCVPCPEGAGADHREAAPDPRLRHVRHPVGRHHGLLRFSAAIRSTTRSRGSSRKRRDATT